MVTAFNSGLEPICDMRGVEEEEAKKMKAFLGSASGIGSGTMNAASLNDTGEGKMSACSGDKRDAERASMHAEAINEDIGDKDLGDEEHAKKEEEIDW